MFKPVACVFVALTAIASVTSASAQSDRAGETTKVQPDAYQHQSFVPETLGVGDAIYQNAKVVTARLGSTEIRFEDETMLTIGPNSDVTIDSYVYSPSSGSGETAIRIGRGVLRMISGRIPADGVRLRTPVATIGIRGTSFWLDTTEVTEVRIWVEEGTVLSTPDQSDQTFELDAPVFAICSAFACVEQDGPGVPGAFPAAPRGAAALDDADESNEPAGGRDDEGRSNDD
ncbi:MAG: FecR family protein [Pseudomonadota bacterium]